MFSPASDEFITSLVRKIPSADVMAPLLVHELDEKFQAMRDECARTLALIERLRASPLHRYASSNHDFDDRRAWSRR